MVNLQIIETNQDWILHPWSFLTFTNLILEKMISKYDRNEIIFSEKALEQIEKHAWNGNIREMENRIERAVILCENNTISASDLDLEFVTTFENRDDIPLSDMEKITIEKVLAKHDYNISKSAEELGLSRAALYRRMEKYKIKIPN